MGDTGPARHDLLAGTGCSRKLGAPYGDVDGSTEGAELGASDGVSEAGAEAGALVGTTGTGVDVTTGVLLHATTAPPTAMVRNRPVNVRRIIVHLMWFQPENHPARTARPARGSGKP
jgi:hypothetical protein